MKQIQGNDDFVIMNIFIISNLDAGRMNAIFSPSSTVVLVLSADMATGMVIAMGSATPALLQFKGFWNTPMYLASRLNEALVLSPVVSARTCAG
jgi:hypothetical protein